MGEVEAMRERVTRRDLRHDRNTVSLLTNHLVFSPKYRGKVLEGEVAEAAEEIIRETRKELDIEVIDKPFFRKLYQRNIDSRSLRSGARVICGRLHAIF